MVLVIEMLNRFPQRKHPRLKTYDYSTPGAYFITICAHKRRCLFSKIVGRGLAPAETVYSAYGQIAMEYLLSLPARYPGVKIDRFVIMPNHIHTILSLQEGCPSIPHIIGAYKSLVTRACKQTQPIDKVFQTSFHEHVIRGQEDYDEIAEYIDNNPKQWELDKLYSEE